MLEKNISGEHANSGESATDLQIARRKPKIRATHGQVAGMCEKQG